MVGLAWILESEKYCHSCSFMLYEEPSDLGDCVKQRPVGEGGEVLRWVYLQWA
jgi:hypothetical protein